MTDPSSLPFALPDITEEEVEAVVKVLRSRWLTTGKEATLFETEFAEQLGMAHGVALNSCTAALHLGLEALGVGPADVVFVPTYTFAASGEVVRYLGAVPCLVDVDPVTLNISVEDLRSKVAQVAQAHRTGNGGPPKAIIPVHIAGVPCEMNEIWQIARDYDLAIVEDAAHAFPASYADHPVGWCPSDVRGVSCFSFYATKTITTGEGGILATNDAATADRVRLMSLHGLSKQAWNRYAGGTWRYDIQAPGFKYNMTDMAAALGRVQLRRSSQMTRRRVEIAEAYSTAFSKFPNVVEVPTVPEGRESDWHLYILRLAGTSVDKRDMVIDLLKSMGVGVSMHFIPLHQHTYYRKSFGLRDEDFPNASTQAARALSLPIWSAMSDDDVRRVIQDTTRVLENL